MKIWLMLAMSGIWASLTGIGLGEEPENRIYQVSILTVKNDWQAIRYHGETGQAWYALHGDWKPVPEMGEKPPSGSYKVLMTAMGENDWFALRLEQKSGRSWRLGALKWIEMKVLSDEKPMPMANAEGAQAAE